MNNYYDNQKKMTSGMIDHLYDNRDNSFRGFRHAGGKSSGALSASDSFRKPKDNKKLVNWENSMSKDSDGKRFSDQSNGSSTSSKNLDSYQIYLKNKKIRGKQKKTKTKSKIDLGSSILLPTHTH